ncbi:MAG: glycosyltransferase [Candidatus Yanofskybacteria bacterium]|nr:glycosyltransferase [Candidatus Yanofskybacteria bacterium]
MKLAIVHDWIVDMGGAERVLIALHRLWPEAPIYTLVAKPSTVQQWFPNATIVPSVLQRLPRAWAYYPALAPMMPSAIESFDLSGFDTVLSSSALFSKGIVVRPGTRHLSYCYSPARMLWDRSASYERRGIFSRLYRHTLRIWDVAAAQRPDELIAISATAAARISKYYRRSAIVVPPPTRSAPLPVAASAPAHPFFLIVARLVPHKSLELVVDAFAKLKYQLVIVGDGPLRRRLSRRARANITFAGAVSDEQLDELYATCQAVVVPNEEDWGLTAVEAMMHGKPVLALRRGGATETVIEGLTGEFFDDPIPEALADGIKRIRTNIHTYDAERIRTHADQWNSERFERRMRTLIEV